MRSWLSEVGWEGEAVLKQKVHRAELLLNELEEPAASVTSGD